MAAMYSTCKKGLAACSSAATFKSLKSCFHSRCDQISHTYLTFAFSQKSAQLQKLSTRLYGLKCTDIQDLGECFSKAVTLFFNIIVNMKTSLTFSLPLPNTSSVFVRLPTWSLKFLWVDFLGTAQFTVMRWNQRLPERRNLIQKNACYNVGNGQQWCKVRKVWFRVNGLEHAKASGWSCKWCLISYHGVICI